MYNIGDLVIRSAKWLGEKGVDSPRLDAELLLAYVLGCDRLRLYMDWHKPLTELEVSAYRELIRSRGSERVPVARLVGKKEFYSRDFAVTPAVFVPRPETEGLVDRAVEMLGNETALQVDRPVVVDSGTGSGCIVVTLAAEAPGPRYIASDISEEALETARKNARTHGVAGQIEFRAGPHLGGYSGPLHLLVSNPAYVRTGEIDGLEPEVSRHDPRAALDGGVDGLDPLRALVEIAGPLLVPGGGFLAELGEDQEEAALGLLEGCGLFEGVRMERDLAGRPRYLMARRKMATIKE